MAAHSFFRESSFTPEIISIMVEAFEKASAQLGTPSLQEEVAKHIIELAGKGERNPDVLCHAALKSLGYDA
jgi:hypothetical protein